jgi:hypothetical protein
MELYFRNRMQAKRSLRKTRLPFRQRSRDSSFPQVAACGYENPAFQDAET